MPHAKPKKRNNKKSLNLKRKLAKFLFGMSAVFFIVTLVPVTFYRYVNPPSTPLMWIRWVESDFQSRYPLYLSSWISLNSVSSSLVRAVIAGEDQKFFIHKGFDWQAIQTALVYNQKSKRRIGASTITMQTARNVFLWQGRNWLRKGFEAYFSILIEWIWSKDRILEVYLNVIEWGDGVFGLENASNYYFKRSAKRLSPVESAAMVSILPNPRKWSIDQPSKTVSNRQSKILKAMDEVSLPELRRN